MLGQVPGSPEEVEAQREVGYLGDLPAKLLETLREPVRDTSSTTGSSTRGGERENGFEQHRLGQSVPQGRAK